MDAQILQLFKIFFDKSAAEISVQNFAVKTPLSPIAQEAYLISKAIERGLKWSRTSLEGLHPLNQLSLLRMIAFASFIVPYSLWN